MEKNHKFNINILNFYKSKIKKIEAPKQLLTVIDSAHTYQEQN